MPCVEDNYLSLELQMLWRDMDTVIGAVGNLHLGRCTQEYMQRKTDDARGMLERMTEATERLGVGPGGKVHDSRFTTWTNISNTKQCNLSGHNENTVHSMSMNFYDLKKQELRKHCSWLTTAGHSIDMMIDWSIDRLIDWSIDRLIDWSIDRLIDWLIDWWYFIFIYSDAKWSVMRNHIFLLQPLAKFPDSQMGWLWMIR